MSEPIRLELQFFLMSIIWGGILLIFYDGIRIFRRTIKHGLVWVTVEDFIFWLISAILIFRMMYQQNNGVIRGFSILGMVVGMVIYNQCFSPLLVNGASAVIHKVLWLVKKVLSIVFWPFNKIASFIMRFGIILVSKLIKKKKKNCKNPLKRLKSFVKKVKITLTR